MKISFQGFEGAYSDMAARAIYPDADTLPCETFDRAFAALRDGDADRSVIPVDNTLAGRVADVHRLLGGGDMFIIGEYFLPIRHALMGLPDSGIADLTTVHSHIHALPQCKKLITELDLEEKVHSDTAGAAAHIARLGDPAQAAIASPLAAKLYGLKVLREDVQDASHNTTRFLVLSRERDIPAFTEDKVFITSLLFTVRNIPAALYKALGGFATNGVNMVKLESYVNENFEAAQFYADVIGHPDDKGLQLALEELDFFAEQIEKLGTYEANSFRKSNNTD